MGAQMAKELGVYNEEEKICTPKNVGHERYRMLNNDPRSVTAGITRTPIQVECTPTGVKSFSQVRSITKSENSYSEECTPTGVKSLSQVRSITKSEISYSEEVENKKQEENDSGYKEEGELSGEVKDGNKCVTPELARYLETDIDKVDSPALNVDSPLKTTDSSSTDIYHSTLITEEKPEPALVDFLSPSVKMSRTPHLVECTPELFALHSRIDSLSFCDFDVHEDPSAVVSDEEHSSPRNQSTINKWLFGVENKLATPGNDSFADSPRTVAKKQKELNSLKKQLFFTPDITVTEPAKPKARTPLGDLQAGQLRESPQRMLKAKQWRNVAEERKRRGLGDAENTPPNLTLPPLTTVASAPGNMNERKRTRINWDGENAMMI